MNDNMARHRQEIESLRTEAYNQKGLAQKWEAEVQRLTKEGADFRNEAEDADLSLACIADQLGIKGSIKDWLQSIGGAIRELKTEVERLSTPRIIGGQEMENILELKAEVERFIDERKGYYAVCQKYREQIEGLEKERDELAKAVGESWYYVAPHTAMPRCYFCRAMIDEPTGNCEHKPNCIVLKCQNVTQVNIDTERTIDESGGQKGDEG